MVGCGGIKIVSAKFLKTAIHENCVPRKFAAIQYIQSDKESKYIFMHVNKIK